MNWLDSVKIEEEIDGWKEIKSDVEMNAGRGLG
jgi:hypothetical protein